VLVSLFFLLGINTSDLFDAQYSKRLKLIKVVSFCLFVPTTTGSYLYEKGLIEENQDLKIRQSIFFCTRDHLAYCL
jgi:hypothetical protein